MFNKKGIAGTTVVIQLMIAVFIIGILGMVIVLTGTSLQDSAGYSTSPSYTILGERLMINLANTTKTGYVKVNSTSFREPTCSISSVQNYTNKKNLVGANWSEAAECGIRLLDYNHINLTVNYSYRYEKANGAVGLVINGTVESVADVPDNFSLWLVVGGLVVVIGLIAFVIVTLRGTGMMGGSSGGDNNFSGNA